MTQTSEFDHLVAELSLPEKVQLLTGRDFWTTWPIERIGLRRMLMSDGPSGVRGEVWDERSPSLNLPSATTLSSAWDREVARRYGAVAAQEARRKDVDIVLGPTINLHRSPLGGRHFEAFSEDPILTAALAASYVTGAQENGVAATPKHYVANDSETDRFTVDVRIDERTLREVYLRAFEDAVVDSRAWLVMSAYNAINGATATENDLLESPLNDEWGFDGVVVSDWTAVRSVRSAAYAQDLAMPGPSGAWGEALVAAVEAGEIDEAAIDRKVVRLLRLASRVGALGTEHGSRSVETSRIDGIAFARDAAAEGMVLLKNEGVLPLESPVTIAVIGQNARQARTQGGGSATVLPERIVTPLDGIRDAFGKSDVTYSIGAIAQEDLAEFDRSAMRNPVTGAAGARVEMLDDDGEVIFAEDRLSSALVYFGGAAPVVRMSSFVFETDYTPAESGPARIGFAGVGTGRIVIDGELRGEFAVSPLGEDLGAAFLSPPSASVPVELRAGTTVRVRLEFRRDPALALKNSLGITIGVQVSDLDEDALIADAAAAAAAADVAIVVVGTNSRVESEGYDRTSLALPGRQDELVTAVAAANPRTIAVVNAGAPVLMPWREAVAGTVVTYFGGQEFGNALADVLRGAREPGGRLPTTWPATQEDVPVIDVTPQNGRLVYDEGIHVGYRAWLRSGRVPAYPFGFGLGYSSWSIDGASAAVSTNDFVDVAVRLQNVGHRAGKQVVQVYAERADSIVERPVRWLVGFAPVRAAAGESVDVVIPVRARDLDYWDGGWVRESGEYTLRIGWSVEDLPVDVRVVL